MKCKQCHQPRPNHKLDCSHPDAQVDRLQNMVESLGARIAALEQTLRSIAYYDLSREELQGMAAEALEEHRP